MRRVAYVGERRSKRARRGEAEVKVSSSNTLWDFKLRLVEALNIHPKNADVHIRLGGTWQKLTNDDATLAGEGQLPILIHLCERWQWPTPHIHSPIRLQGVLGIK